jgi:hypothetical protein
MAAVGRKQRGWPGGRTRWVTSSGRWSWSGGGALRAGIDTHLGRFAAAYRTGTVDRPHTPPTATSLSCDRGEIDRETTAMPVAEAALGDRNAGGEVDDLTKEQLPEFRPALTRKKQRSGGPGAEDPPARRVRRRALPRRAESGADGAPTESITSSPCSGMSAREPSGCRSPARRVHAPGTGPFDPVGPAVGDGVKDRSTAVRRTVRPPRHTGPCHRCGRHPGEEQPK